MLLLCALHWSRTCAGVEPEVVLLKRGCIRGLDLSFLSGLHLLPLAVCCATLPDPADRVDLPDFEFLLNLRGANVTRLARFLIEW